MRINLTKTTEINVHRKEQWDLNCWPLLCVHVHRPNGSRRVFCLWRGGVQVGKFYRGWR